ncbi:MAG TPA: hypothetical protein VFI65_19160 [Streptosporangiaceae bacterium]|nr:hypothetical protein [Streptosporangiaceae bacterium]
MSAKFGQNGARSSGAPGPLPTTDPAVVAATALLAEPLRPASMPEAALRGTLSTYEKCLQDLLDSAAVTPLATRFRYLQALEDAIHYRQARSAGQCVDCTAADGGRCDDHKRDQDLIAVYTKTAEKLSEPLAALERHPVRA